MIPVWLFGGSAGGERRLRCLVSKQNYDPPPTCHSSHGQGQSSGRISHSGSGCASVVMWACIDFLCITASPSCCHWQSLALCHPKPSRRTASLLGSKPSTPPVLHGNCPHGTHSPLWHPHPPILQLSFSVQGGEIEAREGNGLDSPWKAKQSDSASVELLFKMPAFLNPATEFAHCKKGNQRKLTPNYETKVQKCLGKNR